MASRTDHLLNSDAPETTRCMILLDDQHNSYVSVGLFTTAILQSLSRVTLSVLVLLYIKLLFNQRLVE